MPKSLVDNVSSRGKPGLMSSTNFSVANAALREHPVDDPLIDIRNRIIEHLGDGGIKAFGRYFRILKSEGSNKLSPVELQRVFSDCGVELSHNELSRVFTVLNKDDDGNIEMMEFMTHVKGRMPRCRVAIVEKAWATLDCNKDGLVSVKDILERYQVMNHPDVVHGKKTKEEIYMEFLSVFDGPMANDGMVSKDEFIEYYCGVSANIDAHEYFDLIVRNAWNIGQPHDFNRTEQDFKTMIANKFQSSAYWGTRGALPPPDAEDKVQPRHDARFASMISNCLIPFPMPKQGILPKGMGPGSYMGALPNFHITSKTSAKDTPSELSFESSASGKIPGMASSRGFLENGTTTQHMHGEFGDELMDSFAKNKQKEKELADARLMLQRAAFNSAEPNRWCTSSSDYANFAIVDQSNLRKADALPKLARGPQNREKAYNSIQSGCDVDMDALKCKQLDMSTKSLPAGYLSKRSNYSTTMRDHFAGYDFNKAQQMNDRWATEPLQHRHLQPTDEEKDAYDLQQQRYNDRFSGIYNTEKAEHHTDLFDKAEISHKFDVKGVFNLRNGIRTMNDKVHKPKDTVTGLSYNTSQIVPGQFKSMSRKIHLMPDEADDE